MNGLSNEIFRKWVHSFEEDTGDITVYRPVDYNFPRARGRAGIEFKLDGTFINWVIGPTDTQRGIDGNWQVDAGGRVLVSLRSVDSPQTMEILQCDSQVLKVRQRPTSP